MEKPTVMQAKRFGIYSCRPDMTLLSATRLMAEEDISALVVVNVDGYLEGIITRTDLLRARGANPNWMAEPVSNWMVHEVVTVSPRDLLDDVAEVLLKNQIHRVVVVQEENGKRRPIAVISSADLVYHMSKESQAVP